MAQVTVKINGHAYTVGCNDGEEAHLTAMAAAVEKRIDRAKSLGALSGEARMLVMAALLMADELHDIEQELQSLRKARTAGGNGARLTKLAARAEEIAASTERH